ncbi:MULTISPECIES: hypothetical protein [Paenibacillus]|uniref:hypothetical protein n=1 Tax=Paenibacillus TaxID=44249 RepID=UPI0022B85EE0|nr:hypothetical protein [Paenibacillus caseinilyticus]MCZ8518560.1 hypothetical protein [Paenibacillus caseinilyticus]
MNFSELLAGYLGRTIEVFLQNQFFTGVLLQVEADFFIISQSDGTYYSPPVNITILNASVQFVRILA